MFDQQGVKYPGKSVMIAGEMAIIPTLSLKQAKDNADKLKALVKAEAGDAQQLMSCYADALPLFGMAIRRNYPNVTDEQLEDVLDYNLLKQVIPAILGAVPEGELTPAPVTR